MLPHSRYSRYSLDIYVILEMAGNVPEIGKVAEFESETEAQSEPSLKGVTWGVCVIFPALGH